MRSSIEEMGSNILLQYSPFCQFLFLTMTLSFKICHNIMIMIAIIIVVVVAIFMEERWVVEFLL